jgi:uncharacterized protein (DUF1501 family)
MKRRDVLKLGAATYLAAALPRGARAVGPTVGPPRRLVIVFASGAWDNVYALDPKEPTYADVPAGAVQRFGDLDVFCDASRPNVTEFFTKHAALSTIVRGIGTDAINHNETQRRIATGTREETHADFGAIVAHDLGNDLPIPYLVLGDVAFAGPYEVSAARVGATNQITELLGAPSSTSTIHCDGCATSVDGPTAAEQALLATYARASADRARATRGALGYNRKRVDDFVAAIDRADKLGGIGSFGRRGETTSLDAQVTIALDALSQDVAHAVMLNTRLPWDTHADNWRQASCHEIAYAAVTRLVDELCARPGRATGAKMIDDTVVVVISEMGRTPRQGGDPGHEGKGHWPLTSELVIGPGVTGGRATGSTTPDMQAVAIDLATGAPSPTGTKPMYSHFVAGVLALCGVDPTLHLNAPAYHAFVA